MQVIIDIPEEMHKSIEQGSFGAKYTIYDLFGCVMNGTPLPAGHGRLIDADAKDLQSELWTFVRYTGIDEAPYEDACMALDKAPTIVEADGGGAE